jgi:hypothetical protein
MVLINHYILKALPLQHVCLIHSRTHCVGMSKNGMGVIADLKGAASERDLRDGVDWGAKWVVLAQHCLSRCLLLS